MTQPFSFENRVSEDAIACILSLIAAPPQKREKPKAGDLSGSYDFWFDGGACVIHTGKMEFHFNNGTRAFVAAPVSWLSVVIEFADGKRVTIEQSHSS